MNDGVIASLAILSIFFFIFVAVYISSQPYNVTTNDIVWVIERAGILGTIIALVGILYQRHTNKMNEYSRVVRSCDTMLKEIEDHIDTLDQTKDFRVFHEDRRIDYIRCYLNTYGFDTLLHSGLFTYLHRDTQYHLSNLYLRIYKRNEYTQYKHKFIDLYHLSDGQDAKQPFYFDRLFFYERRISGIENDIRKILEPMKNVIASEKERYS